MDWKELWMNIFGSIEWMGLNMGFWVSMGAVAFLVILMNAVFWSMKPLEKKKENESIKK